MAEDPRDDFKRLAHLLIDTFSSDLGIVLKYDEPSVEYLDGYIERNKNSLKEQHQELISGIGSFLGEALIATYGGTWCEHAPGIWGVRFETGETAFPFAKVAKRFGPDGQFDSIASLYRFIGSFLDGRLRKEPEEDG